MTEKFNMDGLFERRVTVEDGSRTHVQSKQEVDDILQYCADERDGSQFRASRAMRPLAEMPMIEYERALRETSPGGPCEHMSVEQWCKAWAYRPENAPFRLSKPRIMLNGR